MSAAAQRIAEGDLAARVEAQGPSEVASLAGSFNQMAARLEAQEQVRVDFIANASHELRTPLTNLQGYLEALRDGVVEPDRATFESLLEEVERLVRLSRSLDTLGGGEAASVPRAAVDLDLTALVRTALDLARPGLERAGIHVSLEAPPGLRARAEPDAVAQVMGNLLQNAARYTPAGGHVLVEVEPGPTVARVSVSNTGSGIPRRPTCRTSSSASTGSTESRDRASGGAGIGLAIVQRLVEASGGQVGVESAAGSTRFWFTLPV